MQLDAVKESSVSTNQSLINKLNQVKEPANLKQLLVEQSIPLFKKLTIKQRELDKVKKQMKTEIHHGSGASTTFNELNGLIKGLKQLISSEATSFGVTPQDIYAHQQVWEEKNANTKTSAVECKLSKPNKPGSVIMVDCAIKGLCPLPFYDIEVLYDLMNWSQGSKSTIHPSWLKDSALVFQVSKDNEKNVKDLVSSCSESGWASSYTEAYTGGNIAFVWKSLSEAFQEDDQFNDDDEENKSASSDNDSYFIPTAKVLSEDESNKTDSNAEVVGNKEGHVQSASSESEDEDNKMDEEKSDHEDESEEEEIDDEKEEDRSDEEQIDHEMEEIDNGKEEDGSDDEGDENEEAGKNEKNGGVSVNKAKRKRDTRAVKQATASRKSSRKK